MHKPKYKAGTDMLWLKFGARRKRKVRIVQAYTAVGSMPVYEVSDKGNHRFVYELELYAL